jgi:hypothetical protein
VKGYYNGVQQGATLTGLGATADPLAVALLGADDFPGQVWAGWLAHWALVGGAGVPALLQANAVALATV